MNKKREILLLEDDKLFAHSLIDFLEELNFTIDFVSDGQEALNSIYNNRYDLYLFDINVPKIDGIELLQTLRDSAITTPTIFLTSYRDDNTLNRCFSSGCDDYLRKPFKLNELMLRINAILKRTRRVDNIVKFSSNYYFDFDKREVYYNDELIKYPLKVIQLLEFIISNRDKMVTTDDIIRVLWSDSQEHSEGALRLYISKVRQIIGKDKIVNIKKVGYSISSNLCE
ncbi:Two-component system response regulator DccR [hydrothermal vent metagenome]|uniref:Two-component system response regulator DccR n=1 Tax=hydrothermal vent metagenome TaxID=652676 RepID=A0A1W1EHE8_9ZZZZ